MAVPPPWPAGCGAGSRWLGLGVAGGAAGEEVVVGAAGEVPLDPFAEGPLHDAAGEAAGVHDRVVPLAKEGAVGQVGGSEVCPVHEVVSSRLSKWVEIGDSVILFRLPNAWR